MSKNARGLVQFLFLSPSPSRSPSLAPSRTLSVLFFVLLFISPLVRADCVGKEGQATLEAHQILNSLRLWHTIFGLELGHGQRLGLGLGMCMMWERQRQPHTERERERDGEAETKIS